MSKMRILVLPIGLATLAIGYWFVSYEAAGSVMLLFFSAAMAVMGLVLIPAAGDVGPTAPVDPEWDERH